MAESKISKQSTEQDRRQLNFNLTELEEAMHIYSEAVANKFINALRVSVSKNQTKSEISGKNVKIQICSNSGY